MAIYKNILCAVDFSDTSEEACRHAVELTRLLGAKLSLLHVRAACDVFAVRAKE